MSDCPVADLSTLGRTSCFPIPAAKSRATPKYPVQSGRFLVTSRSNTTSESTPSASYTSSPNAVPCGRMSRPLPSELNPISVPEHSIPSLSIPKIPRCVMTRPSGILVPSVANGTMSPACMLVAPHHTCRSTPSPASTYTRVTFAASGCFSRRSTFAVTTPFTGVPTRSTDSTAKPSSVMRAAIASTSLPKSANSFSHECKIFMRTALGIAGRWCTSREYLQRCDAL